jgi:nitric oxide dioxygenase
MSNLTEEEISAVQQSLMRLQQSYANFTEEFYQRLFRAAPEMRALFSEDMTEQARKLSVTLLSVISHLRNPAAVMHPLLALATRHVDYGAAQEDFDVVRVCLLGTIQELTPDGLSETELTGWDKALHSVQALMIDHAYPVAS